MTGRREDSGVAALIASPANPRLRAAAALRDRRDRETRGRIVIDGAREIERALDAGLAIEEAFVPVELLRRDAPPQAGAVIAALRAAGATLFGVEPAAMRRLAFGERSGEPVAVAVPPAATLASIALPGDALVVVLEGIEKPGNLGAVVRSADGAGADAVLVAGGPADPWNPNAIRASLGTVLTMPIAVAPTAEVVAWLAWTGLRPFAARVDGALPYTAADFAGPTALVLGSEAHGLSEAWRGAGITAVRLPMHGRADSLNVAAAAAVLLYEARRQRDAPSGRIEERGVEGGPAGDRDGDASP